MTRKRGPKIRQKKNRHPVGPPTGFKNRPEKIHFFQTEKSKTYEGGKGFSTIALFHALKLFQILKVLVLKYQGYL